MVTSWLLRWWFAVDSVLSAVRGWALLLAAALLLAVAALTADTVRTRIRTGVRTLSGRRRVRCCSMPLTSPDTVRTRSADDRPDASGHIPGGGP